MNVKNCALALYSNIIQISSLNLDSFCVVGREGSFSKRRLSSSSFYKCFKLHTCDVAVKDTLTTYGLNMARV